MTMSTEEARQRIGTLVDDEDFIFGIIYAGESDTARYFLVVHSRTHDGNRYLNERYVLLAKDSADIDDTYMKNGINRRISSGLPDLAYRLADVYQQAANFQHDMRTGARGVEDIEDYEPPLYDCNGGD